MADGTTWVGLDVHEATIAVAVIRAGREEVEDLGIIAHQPAAVRKLLDRLGDRDTLRGETRDKSVTAISDANYDRRH